MKAEPACAGLVCLPLRGQHRLGSLVGRSLLFPVELQAANRLASTNWTYFKGLPVSYPTMQEHNRLPAMSSPDLIDQIAERVERLLVRHEELQRTNALLAEQVQALTQERDSLKSRLNAARARVDALIDRLPGAAAEEQS